MARGMIRPVSGTLPKPLLVELRARGCVIDQSRLERAKDKDTGDKPAVITRLGEIQQEGLHFWSILPGDYKAEIDLSKPERPWSCSCPDATESGGMKENCPCKHAIALALAASDRYEAELERIAHPEKLKPTLEPEPEPAKVALPGLAIDGGFYVEPLHLEGLATIDRLAKGEGKAVVICTGPSGCGKTTLGKKMAGATGRGWVRINCAGVRDPEEWFGTREARDGSTVFDRSQLAEALGEPDIVIGLDELNRIEPWLHSPLFPLLDDDGCTMIHGDTYKVSPNTIFWLTLNEGTQYTGTFQLDEALRQRAVLVLRLGHLRPENEKWVLEQAGANKKLAKDLSLLMDGLRNLRDPNLECDLSVRAAKNMCKLVRYGLTLRQALEFEVLNMLGDEVQQKAARDLINAKAGVL